MLLYIVNNPKDKKNDLDTRYNFISKIFNNIYNINIYTIYKNAVKV